MRNTDYLSFILLFCLLVMLAVGATILTNRQVVGESRLLHSEIIMNTTAEFPVKVIGFFTNVKVDAGHEHGYSMELWMHGDEIVGMISGGDEVRLLGDTPIGRLTEVRFEPKTKRISFKSKLSIGQYYSNEYPNGTPSRDVYSFEGVLKKKLLQGELIALNELCPDGCPSEKDISLSYSKEMSSIMAEYPSYSEWDATMKKILAFRGPRW